MKHMLGTATTVNSCGVTLKDGTQLPAHMVIYCGGCEYQGSPPFLRDLKLGGCSTPVEQFPDVIFPM